MTTRANCTRSENVRPSASVLANSTNEPPARSPLHSLYRNRSATDRRTGRAAAAGVTTSERTGTAAVGDSGKASISVASTGLLERIGLPGGVGLDSAGLGRGINAASWVDDFLSGSVVRASPTDQEKQRRRLPCARRLVVGFSTATRVTIPANSSDARGFRPSRRSYSDEREHGTRLNERQTTPRRPIEPVKFTERAG